MNFKNLKKAFNNIVEGFFMQKKIFFFFYVVFTAIGVKAQDDSYNERMDFLFEKGYENSYINKDSAIYYFDKMRDAGDFNNDLESTIDASIGIARVLEYHNDLQALKITLNKLDSIFATHKNYINNIPEGTIYKVYLAYQKGHYFYVTDAFDSARKSFNEILVTIENHPEANNDQDFRNYLSTAYSYLAKMYSDEGKLDLAEEYYEKNIRYLKLYNLNDKRSLFGNYDLISEVLKRKQLYKEANSYLFKTLDYNIKNPKENSVLTILNIVQNYNSLGQKDSANHYLQVAKSILKISDPSLSHFHEITAETFAINGEYENALKEFNKALGLAEKKFNNKPHWDIAHLNHKIGNLYINYNQNQKAIDCFDDAIYQLKTSNSILNQNTLVKIYKDKALVLNQNNSNDSYLSTTEIVEIATHILDTLKPTFKKQADKLFLIEDAFPLFESGLEAAYQLYQSSKDEKYIDQAFYYAEKSKSVLLLEALLSAKANQFANIPNDLLERERQLKSEITYIKKQLNRSTEADNEKEDQLFELKEEHRQLINTIETDYKTYYDLKYNTKTLSLLEMQNLLVSDELLISYFYGNDAIYAIGVAKSSKQIHRIPIDSFLESSIKQMHKMLADSKSDVIALGEVSNKLYRDLIAPFSTSEEKKKLIIISDGLLNYIPFGALNTEEKSLSYLIENHAVSYANSATLYAQLMQRTKKEGELLAFAPEFSGEQVQIDPNRSNLLPLPHNTREVEQILNSFTGQSYVHENASLLNFTTQLSKYGMLHLATHAVFDDTAPEYSYLAFSSTNNQENLLYVSDLYNLQINADLVTLSACESGVGELKRGEGFLSLARGFFYSGASSIASTLWKINDASTTTLMNSFYKNLSEGNTKNVALQKAKINFLETNRQNGLSHPYYWSGFIVSGNTAALVANTNWLWVIIAIALSAFIGLFIYRKFKKLV